MAFAERLADLLEPELDKVDLAKGESIHDVLRKSLQAMLQKAGVGQLNKGQRHRAYEILSQCWATSYGAALHTTLFEAGYLP